MRAFKVLQMIRSGINVTLPIHTTAVTFKWSQFWVPNTEWFWHTVF